MGTEGAESWFAGLPRAGWSRTKSYRVTTGCLQSALTQGTRSQILTLEVVVGPDLTHITCLSPGHPTADGQLVPIRGKELVRGKGVTFHLLKSSFIF